MKTARGYCLEFVHNTVDPQASHWLWRSMFDFGLWGDFRRRPPPRPTIR